ncbi:MAG: NADH:ubiquinone reductase (Na(+)-transporting) subunit C [Myxococcota bacterium]
MRKNSSHYTFLFAVLLCVCLSSTLSITHMLLRDAQQQSRLLDQQKNILVAAGLKPQTPEQIQQLFQQQVQPLVINSQGSIITGQDPADLEPDSPNLPLYRIAASQQQGQNSSTLAYVYPIVGKGLWSVLQGYLAVSPDGRTVVGVSFFEHEETPGLGGEISKPWFQNNFIGKHLYEAGKLVGITVVKGKAKDQPNFSRQKDHMVDGISGATITGNGVTQMMYNGPQQYEPFFAKLRSRS